MANRAKAFEKRFASDWERTVQDSLCYRLLDVMSGYKAISNAGDYICFKSPSCFIIDCKSTEQNTFSVNFRQYDQMVKYMNIPGLHCGVIIWFINHDKCVWVPIETFVKLKADDKKSFNVKMIGSDEYFHIEIPSKKIRTYLSSDYENMVEYYRGKDYVTSRRKQIDE